MREKINYNVNKSFKVFSAEQETILKELRIRAQKILQVLYDSGISAYTYGSLTRGDVKQSSDIDIVIPYPIGTYRIELALDEFDFGSYNRVLTQATPNHTPKGIFQFSNGIDISFPLLSYRERELDFYSFSGKATLGELLNKKYTPGVNKKLELIIPIIERRGYWIDQVIGNERDVAKVLGTKLEIIEERVRVLIQREKIGRRGIFLKRFLHPDEQFEEVFSELKSRNPVVKRLIRKRK